MPTELMRQQAELIANDPTGVCVCVCVRAHSFCSAFRSFHKIVQTFSDCVTFFVRTSEAASIHQHVCARTAALRGRTASAPSFQRLVVFMHCIAHGPFALLLSAREECATSTQENHKIYLCGIFAVVCSTYLFACDRRCLYLHAAWDASSAVFAWLCNKIAMTPIASCVV